MESPEGAQRQGHRDAKWDAKWGCSGGGQSGRLGGAQMGAQRGAQMGAQRGAQLVAQRGPQRCPARWQTLKATLNRPKRFTGGLSWATDGAMLACDTKRNMAVMDWDKLRIFHAVADKGSLTHAGDVLHLSQSAVSRQIRALEESLSVTLFHRHARGLILTEQGELLFDATSQMVRRLEAAAARIRDSEDEVFGELRVTTTTGFGTLWLAPVAMSERTTSSLFMSRYLLENSAISVKIAWLLCLSSSLRSIYRQQSVLLDRKSVV